MVRHADGRGRQPHGQDRSQARKRPPPGCRPPPSAPASGRWLVLRWAGVGGAASVPRAGLIGPGWRGQAPRICSRASTAPAGCRAARTGPGPSAGRGAGGRWGRRTGRRAAGRTAAGGRWAPRTRSGGGGGGPPGECAAQRTRPGTAAPSASDRAGRARGPGSRGRGGRGAAGTRSGRAGGSRSVLKPAPLTVHHYGRCGLWH
jgi:hypothetical protein